MRTKNSHYISLLFLIVSYYTYSQSDPNNLVFNGNKESVKKNYIEAEVEYRKAISKDKTTSKAAHNLGNILFENENYDEAIQEYFKTQKNSELNLEKHSAFHNLGNSYMKKKDYAQAIEAYKNALRNNSEDDETRYNYALAKKFLEGDKRQNSQNNNESEDKKKDKSEDKKENKEQDQKSDQDSDSEKEKPKEQDQNEEKDQGGGLSKQQMENLLEAVNNIEKDLNQKLKSGKKKVQTTKKAEKDW
ncbi:tetratricopeptide repeat protein [Flavobacteriaceae bacterium]|jgi:tetratricopeptide (TPR) repeat protein|nr:tetratricopeptide repeat protein [Flavobacteriaceae bacterium]MDA9883861.1 tetratricopeptide repeat protein [Flavobacteriaceae bacterium]MDC1010563.1 tetratricopeptide repeat protein [Flavobacteriaceae bacterium]MDC3219266.1 tetratricopeptide repeat protein [Flavobacteriaceae bacterium]MDC3297584.1 tetratricopeptide repeat protein [Flavobacteriaceae bacterium]